MRALLPGLASPHPLADTLPGVLAEDAFARSLCAAFDDVLAPVLLTLDGYDATLDLALTPADLLPWYAHWLAVEHVPGDLGDDERTVRLRELVAGASATHALRGTAEGIGQAVRAATGIEVEVTESGAAAWSDRAGGALPGAPDPAVTVTARPAAGVEVDLERLTAVVRQVTPAHVAITVTA